MQKVSSMHGNHKLCRATNRKTENKNISFGGTEAVRKEERERCRREMFEYSHQKLSCRLIFLLKIFNLHSFFFYMKV